MGLALVDDEVDSVEDLAVLRADVQVLDLEAHAACRSFFGVRSSSVMSVRVRTIEPWTRVQSSFVGHRASPLTSREHMPSGVMHSIGARWPSRAETISAIVISPAGRDSV